jgi:O-antigen biosynthesis protein
MASTGSATKARTAVARSTAKKAATKRAARRGKAGPVIRRAAELPGELAMIVHEQGEPGTAQHVELARLARGAGEDVELLFGSGERRQIEAAQWRELRSDLKEIVREELAALDAETRRAVQARLLEQTGGAGLSRELSDALHRMREVLRERLPRCAVDARQPVGLSVEQILAVDDASFWINGWVQDSAGGAVDVVSPEGARTTITDAAVRYERPDVVQFYSALAADRTSDHGFTCFFTLAAPSLRSRGWIAELHTDAETGVEVECPPVLEDPLSVRHAIFGELAREPLGGRLCSEHARQALTRLQQRIVAEAKVAETDVYGRPPRDPEVSIVVPLYKRLDFVEHQLLQFSRDPDFARAELLFVLDSVEQADELARKAHALHALYGLPFKVLTLSSPAGYAGANQHAIAAARGRLLLLLNSDVIPDRPGWIGAMSAFYDATDGIGALGPKLLYEDDSLQHAGLYFHRGPGSELWENAHCFKGLHRSFAAANVTRPVPAVTAACMLLDRELYEQVEGLPLHYVQGDYEDSELCLRLAQAGRASWYLPSVELYHLEGQSYEPDLRRQRSDYNRWLHSEIWGEQIEQAMSEFDPHATVAAATGRDRSWKR